MKVANVPLWERDLLSLSPVSSRRNNGFHICRSHRQSIQFCPNNSRDASICELLQFAYATEVRHGHLCDLPSTFQQATLHERYLQGWHPHYEILRTNIGTFPRISHTFRTPGRVFFFKFMRDTTPRTSFICDRAGVSRKKLRQEEVTISIENIHSISTKLSDQRNGCQVSWNGISRCYPLIGLICLICLISLRTLLSNKKINSSIDCSIIICWFLKMYSQLQM